MSKRIKSLILCFLLAFVMVGGSILPGFCISAEAASNYSNVMDDLSKDPNFNPEDYPEDFSDYSLKLIQLAEGENGQVYLYVYQPAASSRKIYATSVNLSNTGDASGLKLYDLQLLNESGVFQKYEVLNLVTTIESVCKYMVVSIYRPFDASLGDQSSDPGTVGVRKAIPVEIVWTVKQDLSGNLIYSAEYTDDVIQVVSSNVGFFRYSEGLFLAASDIRSHFFAFSTNKPIDSILEADIEYEYYHYYFVQGYRKEESGKKVVRLTSDQIFEVNDSNFFTSSYEFKRIQSVDDFLECEGVNVSEDSLPLIREQEWILRFVETNHLFHSTTTSSGLPSIDQYYTDINSITLFRLKYEFDGQIYDVGVISDSVRGDGISDGEIYQNDWFLNVVRIILLILVIVIIIFVLNTVTPLASFVNLIWKFIRLFAKFLFLIVSFPFKIVRFIFVPKKKKRR